MSLDRSLKIAASLSGKRSVMTRAERIEKMSAEKKFDPKKDKALGIPKTLMPTK
ncbi:MAG: small basic protein [Phycisphaerales bacterium]